MGPMTQVSVLAEPPLEHLTLFVGRLSDNGVRSVLPKMTMCAHPSRPSVFLGSARRRALRKLWARNARLEL